jgi:hypothetical protein
MCLSRLGDFKIKGNIGYKVFLKRGVGEYEGMYYHAGSTCYVKGKRYVKAFPSTFPDFRIHTYATEETYLPGFHVFLKYRDARSVVERHGGTNLVIKRVRFGTVVAKGFDTVRLVTVIAKGCDVVVGDAPTIVAKTMTIL